MSKPQLIVSANTSWYLYNFRLPLLKALLNHGYAVLSVAPTDKYVDKLQGHNINHIHVSVTRSGLNPFADCVLLLKYISVYKKCNPTIVQHFTIKPVIYGTIAARLCRIKHIYNMIPGMGYVFTGTSLKKALVQRIVRLLYRRTIKYSTHVFFQNAEDQDYFIRYKLVDPAITNIVPGTGVDTDKFKPRRKKAKKGMTFVMSSRLLWDKGVGEYVKAAQMLRRKHENIHFWLLGPVDLENPKAIRPEQLNAWNRAGDVQYLGMTDDIKSYLAKADVIVLPSYYREGIPLSLLEGAAMGMPIITSDSTGCREVVQEGKNGLLVPVKDVQKLATAMEAFIKKPTLVSTMGRESRKIACQKFDSRFAVREILKFYPQ